MEKKFLAHACIHSYTREHKHASLRRWLLATVIVMIMLPIVGRSQNSCLTAVSHTPNKNWQWVAITPPTTEYWLTFVGDTTSRYFATVAVNDTANPKPKLQSATLYNGSCSTLNQLAYQDSTTLNYDEITQGQTYYLKLVFTSLPSQFQLQSTFTQPKSGAYTCPPTSCVDAIVSNGDFLTMEYNVITSSNPYPQADSICAWDSYRNSSPQATPEMGYLDNGYTYMWGSSNGTTNNGEGIRQNIYLPAGTYDVALAARLKGFNSNPSVVIMDITDVGYNSNINTSLTDPSINILTTPTINSTNWTVHTGTYVNSQSGNRQLIVMPYQTTSQVSWVGIDNIIIKAKPAAQIIASYCKPNMNFACTLDECHTIDHVVWDFGDGNSTTSQGQNITSHQYGATGVYTVQATIYYTIYNSPAIISIVKTETINVGGAENELDISGNKNTCDSITFYSAINTFPNTNCTWTINPSTAGTIVANNNHTITINWHENAITNGQPVTLTLNDGLCNTSIKIWKCCKDSSGTATAFNDETITSNINNGTYYLNGTITINGNITVSNAIFNMAPEAKIVLNAPSTFNVNLSTIKAGCNYMWDGIYNQNSNSSITTETSTIQDAQNAIYSENGGYVSASNTLFNLNNYGIKVYNSTVANPLNVSNCRFYCTTDGTGVTPRNLIEPMSGNRGNAGIDINNVSAIQVGDINKATKNKFSYTVYGININNSNATVYNNNFVNFPVVNSYYGAGIAILGTNSATRSAVIGGYNSGNNIYTNLFSNCRIGIYQQNQANIKVLCDTFVSSVESATKITSNSYRNIDFTKNRIQSSPYGLLINDFINTRLVVDSNSIYNVTNGITASNATAQECYGATFRKNTITGTFTNGILLSNVRDRSVIPEGFSGHERQNPYIYANTITFGSYDLTGLTIYSGIRVENGNNTFIEDNIVSTPSYAGTDLSQALKLNGIYVFASPQNNLCGNTLTRLGMGIRMSGLCSGSYFKSNTMDNNFYGVRLDAATIGNQGVAAARWVYRNWWHTPFVISKYRVQGSVAAATLWTYDSPINYTLLSLTPEYSVTGGFTTSAVTNPVLKGTCGFDGVIWVPYNSGTKGDESEESSVMENYLTNVEENQYYQASNFYYETQSDKLNLDAVESTSTPVNPIQTTAITQFYKVDKMISKNRIDEAVDLNNSILPVNLIESNHKIANAIYLQSWAKGRYNLTDDEKSTLSDIANQSHIKGGSGVFTAWVMLNRSIQNDDIINPNGTKLLDNNTSVYPNPAHEQVTITGASDVSFATIYDIQGRELLKIENSSGSSIFTINTSKLSKGVYFITLINSNLTNKKVEKLVIE